jgi:hypothetical protein
MTLKRSRFDVGWQDWAVALALGAIVLLLGALALATLGGWSHQRDVARAMEPPPGQGAARPAPAADAAHPAAAPRRGAGEAGAPAAVTPLAPNGAR